ncbi:MAG: hypothetical protein LBE13_03915 [Bacteroidales bacterium]|jgi:hypothetical protein|nr:hypothetical protein [Bacteroidales bacterium]
MYKLTDIKPIQLNDLVRIGKQQDGGYVITRRQLEKTDILLSFGISADWSFDNDFLHKARAERRGVSLYAYDYSVSANILRKHIIKALFFAMYKFATFDFKTAKERVAFAVEKMIHPFPCFFNPAKNRYFFKKYLGNHDNDEYISVDTVFSTHLKPQVKDLSVFVKMDIEESEYRTLPAFKPFYRLINGFAIEFHNLDILGNNFTEIVREMSEYFYVAHVHANNYGGYIYPSMLPKTLEITFINKKLIPEPPVNSTYSYPVHGLDFPCNPKIPEIPIMF